ncbi:MAG: N-acetylmuramoyl-L-alanine amidase, partial [Coriobacteriia bacterium]
MSPADPTYGRRRDDSASMTRIVLTLLGVLVAVGLAGWAFAAAIPRPDTTAETPTVTPAVQPIATPTPTPTPAAVATGSTESSSVSSATARVTPPAPEPKPAAPAPSPAPSVATASGQFVVVIDPGHQARGNNTPEPIGPGSKSTKPAVSSGTAGTATKRDESLVNLEISLKIQKELEASGVKVIMVRTKQDVNITNSERATIANEANADLFLRIHCDSAGSSVNGLLTMVPAKNTWTGPIVAPSAKAGKAIQSATLKTTGAHDRGIVSTSEMSGFNWSKVPAVIVEMGLMSNPAEDRL